MSVKSASIELCVKNMASKRSGMLSSLLTLGGIQATMLRFAGRFALRQGFSVGGKLIGSKLLLLSASATAAAAASVAFAGKKLRTFGETLTQVGTQLEGGTSAASDLVVQPVVGSTSVPAFASLAVAAVLVLRGFWRTRAQQSLPPTPSRGASVRHRRAGDLELPLFDLCNPPKCTWASKRRYVTFLSHYKKECGSDARYLKDLLERMTEAEVFLDSSDLVDLGTLFSHGVHQADSLLLLCSEGVLSRPWCLLEVFEAHEHGVPVVEMLISRHDFPSAEVNRTFILNLEEQLELRNPGAMGTLMEYLNERGVGLEHFKSSLLAALALDGGAARRRPLTWHPWGSDNQVIADAMDVLNAMGSATGQTLSWPHTHAVRDAAVPPRALEPGAKYAIFISYYRAEAGLDARSLHTALEKRLGLPCFLDASCAASVIGGQGLGEISAIVTAGVQHSEALVLVQTRSVLSRPFVLLEVYTALKLGLPIFTLKIDAVGHPGVGYDYEGAKAFLASLRDGLARENPGAAELMDDFFEQHGGSFAELQGDLFHKLPNMISISWSPDGTSNHWQAVVEDVVHKVSLQQEARTREHGHSRERV
jgi:hypothetical protein